MKLLYHSIQLTLILSLVFSTMAIAKKTKVKGTWKYEAQGTPYEYSSGEITITKKGKKYDVTLYTNYEKMTATNVEVNKTEVTFHVYITDMGVDITMNVEGDKMTGKAVTSEGAYLLSGDRK